MEDSATRDWSPGAAADCWKTRGTGHWPGGPQIAPTTSSGTSPQRDPTTTGHQRRSRRLAGGLLVGWVVLYLRISAPINRTLTAAADAHQTPANARALQRDWDRIIVPHAVLQGLAVAALGVSLIS